MAKDKDSNDLLMTALIAGAVGIFVGAVYFSSRQPESQSSSLSSLGRIAVRMGEMLTADDVDGTPIFKNVEKKAHKHEKTVSEILELVSTGFQLWQKIKKGK